MNYMELLDVNNGISDDVITAAEKEMKIKFPKEYRDFMLKYNGCEGEIGQLSYISMWKIEELAELNKSYSFSQIQADLDAKKYQIGSDVFTIHEMPVFSYEAMVVYKETLDLSKALTEGKRLADIQKKKQEELEKQEAEKKVAEQKKVSDEESQQIEFNTIESFDENVLNNLKATQEKDEKREWVAFNAYLTPEDAQALVEFFKNRNISFKPV